MCRLSLILTKPIGEGARQSIAISVTGSGNRMLPGSSLYSRRKNPAVLWRDCLNVGLSHFSFANCTDSGVTTKSVPVNLSTSSLDRDVVSCAPAVPVIAHRPTKTDRMSPPAALVAAVSISRTAKANLRIMTQSPSRKGALSSRRRGTRPGMNTRRPFCVEYVLLVIKFAAPRKSPRSTR